MEVYEHEDLANGDVLLKKVFIDNKNFTTFVLDNGDILLKKIVCVNINCANDIKKYDFVKSKIISCSLNNNKIVKLKFKSILCDVYGIINNGAVIIKKSALNIKTTKKTDSGFYYLKNVGISVQGADSNKCLLEIISQCTENKIHFWCI
jgi:hypothetical protein